MAGGSFHDLGERVRDQVRLELENQIAVCCIQTSKVGLHDGCFVRDQRDLTGSKDDCHFGVFKTEKERLRVVLKWMEIFKWRQSERPFGNGSEGLGRNYPFDRNIWELLDQQNYLLCLVALLVASVTVQYV